MDRFLHISSQQKGVAGLEMPTDVAQKHLCCRWIKIADGASQKQYQECLIRLAVSHGFLKSFQIRFLQADNADCADVPQFLVAFDEGRSGYVDGEIGHRLSIGERFQYPASLSAGALPNSTTATGGGRCSSMSPAWRRRRRSSARVSPYSGSRVIASNSAVPSSSYRYIEGSSRWPTFLRLSPT